MIEKLPLGCDGVFPCLHQQPIIERDHFLFILLYSEKKKQPKNFQNITEKNRNYMYNNLSEEEDAVFRWRSTLFLYFTKTLLLMIWAFARLFHGTEHLVASHTLRYKTGMKISSLSKHSVSPLLFSCEAASPCSGTFLLVKSFLFYSKSTDAIGQLEIYRASGISLTENLKFLLVSFIYPTVLRRVCFLVEPIPVSFNILQKVFFNYHL